MKKVLFLFSLPILFLSSCSSEPTNDAKSSKSEAEVQDSIVIKLDTLRGIYYGDFGGSEIRIALTYLSPNHGVGYNVLKGLQRNISGKLTENAKDVLLELHEPGDHKYDGIFYLTISKEDFSCTGKWVSNDKKIKERNFTLKKLIYSSVDPYSDTNMTAKDVTKENFTNFFYDVQDSIGRLMFEDDGLCSYKFYESYDTLERKEQYQEIDGTWNLKDGKVIVQWSKNNHFPKEKSYFDIFVDAPNYDYRLILGKRVFHAIMMP